MIMISQKVNIGLLLTMMIFITGFTVKNTDSRITLAGETIALNEIDTMGEITNSVNGIHGHITTNDSVRHMVNH